MISPNNNTQIGQTVLSPRLTANLALLRQYLDQVFYPQLLPQATTTEPDDEQQGNNPFADFNVDLSDFNPCLDTEAAVAYYTPIQRVLMLHRLFVVFCGHRQTNWWDAYIAELLHFFGECGETPLIVQLTLREPEVMQTLRPFCS